MAGSRQRRTASLSRNTPRPKRRPAAAAPPPPDGPALYVRRVRGMGRGVFAGRRYRKGEVIEVCPVIPLTRREYRALRGGVLDRYVFLWTQPGYAVAVVLGLGSIYNTSSDPNCRYTQRWTTQDMVYRATRDIEPGEQILVDYGWAPGEFDIPIEHTNGSYRRSVTRR